MPSSAFANGTILNGEYTLLDPIPGSDGRVLRARRVRDGELFAARLITPRYAMDIARAFERLDDVAQVRHPAIAAVESFGEHEGRLVIISEYVDGRPLDLWADAVGIPPLSRVIALVHRICAGLHVAERLRVAHAALHPGNVLVVQRNDDEKPQIKVVDIGVPAFMREWPERPERVPYMAPEQVLAALTKPGIGPDTDSHAHVYACGCLLYELCTGGAPFAEQDMQELAVAHAEGKLPLPSRINPLVPPALDAIIMKALARLPEVRFARSVELAQALAGLRLTSSASGVRPRVSIPPPVPAAGPSLEDKRTTARAGFEERPTVERQLPSDWPDIARLSPVPGPPQEVPTVRPPPPAAPVAVPVPVSRPSQPARILPPDPFAMAVVVESAPLARVEPEAMLAAPDPQNRYIFVSAQVRERSRARKLRLVLYFAAGFAATTAGFFALRGPGIEVAPAPGADLTTVASSDAAAMAMQPAPDLARVVSTEARPEREVPIVNVPAERDARPSSPGPARLRRPRAEPSSLAAEQPPSVVHADAAQSPHAAADVAAEAALPASRESARNAPAEEPHAEREATRGIAESKTAADEKIAHLQPAGHKLSSASASSAPVNSAPAPAPVSLGSAKLGVASLEVRGSLATSEVRRGLDRIRAQLRACYTGVPPSQSAAVPRNLRVEVDIDERGRARNPRVMGRAPAALSQCVAQSVQRLVSASPPDTGTVKASFVLELEP